MRAPEGAAAASSRRRLALILACTLVVQVCAAGKTWPKLYWIDGTYLVRSDYDGYVEEEVSDVNGVGATFDWDDAEWLYVGGRTEATLPSSERASFSRFSLYTGEPDEDSLSRVQTTNPPQRATYHAPTHEILYATGFSPAGFVETASHLHSELTIHPNCGLTYATSSSAKSNTMYVVCRGGDSSSNGIWKFPLPTGPASIVLAGGTDLFDDLIDIAVDDKHDLIYFLDNSSNSNKRRIGRVSVNGGTPKDVCRVPETPVRGLTVDPDGEFVYVSIDTRPGFIKTCFKNGAAGDDNIPVTIASLQAEPGTIHFENIPWELRDPGKGGTGFRRGAVVVRRPRWQDMKWYVIGSAIFFSIIGTAYYFTRKDEIDEVAESSDDESTGSSDDELDSLLDTSGNELTFETVSPSKGTVSSGTHKTLGGSAAFDGLKKASLAPNPVTLGGSKAFSGLKPASLEQKKEKPAGKPAAGRRRKKSTGSAGSSGSAASGASGGSKGRKRSGRSKGRERSNSQSSPKEKPSAPTADDDVAFDTLMPGGHDFQTPKLAPPSKGVIDDPLVAGLATKPKHKKKSHSSAASTGSAGSTGNISAGGSTMVKRASAGSRASSGGSGGKRRKRKKSAGTTGSNGARGGGNRTSTASSGMTSFV